MAKEVSRFSRSDKDWCHLLEVCRVFDTLLAESEHIYDLRQMDDKLVLGIKSTMSVMELNVLRQRMHEGAEAKARRGELFRSLPTGYVLDNSKKAIKHPDARVRRIIALVFSKFHEIGSIRQTYLWFHH